MSHHSDEGSIVPGNQIILKISDLEMLMLLDCYIIAKLFYSVGSDSFWEPGNYKRTTKYVILNIFFCRTAQPSQSSWFSVLKF